MNSRLPRLPRLVVLALFLLLPVASLTAQATFAPPADLDPGQRYRVIFVTASARDALSTDIADYNAFVTADAMANPSLAALGTSWAAVASTETVSARQNTSTDPAPSPSGETGVPIYNVTGQRVANDYAHLWSSHIDKLAPASGSTTPSSGVWTGTDPVGNTSARFLGNTMQSPALGRDWRVDFQWIQGFAFGSNPGTPQRPLYGMSAELTVPYPQAPAEARLRLAYNFNGIVHDGEAGDPDNPNGFRSVSDRALDFRGGVPAHAILDGYDLVATPGTLDLVHLGNRNTVEFGNRAFDPAPDGDLIGTQPTWLSNVDQSGPQVTQFAPAESYRLGVARLGIIYQISNGGGSFDVTLRFLGGASTTRTVSAPDWLGGDLAATDTTDLANNSATNLVVTEASIDLFAFEGLILTGIEFSNATNPNGGVAVFGATLHSCIPNVTGYGAGCSSPATGEPALSPSGMPCIGGFVRVASTNLAALDYYVSIGFDSTPVDFAALGGPTGCLLLNELALVEGPFATTSMGLALPIPQDPTLTGRHVYFQALVPDLSLSAGIPVLTSRGLDVQL